MPIVIVAFLAAVGLFTSIVLDTFHTSEISALIFGVAIVVIIATVPIILLIIDGERQYRKKKREKEQKKAS